MESITKMEEFLKKCTLCPRNCKVNRMADKAGYCGQSASIYVARAALHMWEEPCISGGRGSGTVFFSGCNLRCVFCQNHEIAAGRAGKEIDIEHLAKFFAVAKGGSGKSESCHGYALCAADYPVVWNSKGKRI